MKKNRITHVWDAIENSVLREAVAVRERHKAAAFMLLMKAPVWRLSFQVLVHVHPLDKRITYRHTTLFIGSLPIMVVNTVAVPSG